MQRNFHLLMKPQNMRSDTISIPHIYAELALPSGQHYRIDGEVDHLKNYDDQLAKEFGVGPGQGEFEEFGSLISHIEIHRDDGGHDWYHVGYWRLSEDLSEQDREFDTNQFNIDAHLKIIREMGLQTEVQQAISRLGYDIDTTNYHGYQWDLLLLLIAFHEEGRDITDIGFKGPSETTGKSLVDLVVNAKSAPRLQ